MDSAASSQEGPLRKEAVALESRAAAAARTKPGAFHQAHRPEWPPLASSDAVEWAGDRSST